LRVDDVVEIVYKCAKALHYAHSRGVIHRDIKPSNIMLNTESDVRIIDFGIALVADSDVSRIEGIAGSPSYMSPEQVQGDEITSASDVYSLGAMMYEMLTGFRPYRASSLSKLLHQIVYATPEPLHKLRPDIPEDLERICAKAMHKDPEKRYANGTSFAADLTRVFQKLRSQQAAIDQRERFDILRRLRFFHDFSHSEIWEVLRASDWRECPSDEEIVKEGEADDRFYIIVAGNVHVVQNGKKIGMLGAGECFGETSYVQNAKRTATIMSDSEVIVLRVSSTLLEQVSSSTQLRFVRVFLQNIIERLQRAGTAAT
ncbi:MAG: serine/threonine-protein kinase, partial [Gammaproteobacteria bacterium]|nr:serine/threonine-protein kinase [Gammaproteobacteria bacterium]